MGLSGGTDGGNLTDDLLTKFVQIGSGCRMAFLRRPIGIVAGRCWGERTGFDFKNHGVRFQRYKGVIGPRLDVDTEAIAAGREREMVGYYTAGTEYHETDGSFEHQDCF